MMKKFFFYLAALLPLFAMSACSSDDENLEIEPAAIVLDYNETATLKASEKNCVWSSADEFVATVDDNGVVTGCHVGETVIYAQKDGLTGACRVKVEATNNNFTEPIITWGLTPAATKSAVAAQNIGLGQPEIDTDTDLGYYTDGSFPMYAYSFVNNGLAASSLAVTVDMDEEDDLYGFLNQRYFMYSDDDTHYYFINASKESDATVKIRYGYDLSLDCVTVFYTPLSASVRSAEATSAAIEANREILRKLLNK